MCMTSMCINIEKLCYAISKIFEHEEFDPTRRVVSSSDKDQQKCEILNQTKLSLVHMAQAIEMAKSQLKREGGFIRGWRRPTRRTR